MRTPQIPHLRRSTRGSPSSVSWTLTGGWLRCFAVGGGGEAEAAPAGASSEVALGPEVVAPSLPVPSPLSAEEEARLVLTGLLKTLLRAEPSRRTLWMMSAMGDVHQLAADNPAP